MLYIVGLGNFGEKYKHQRHNVGFTILDELITVFGLPEPVASGKYSGSVSEGMIEGVEVKLLYPNTFMNNSGKAARKLVPKGQEGNLLLIYDDVDIPLGQFKLSMGRGDGGHNGVSSVIASLGTKQFMRLRVGIAQKGWFGGYKRPVGAALPTYVLSDFRKSERPIVASVSKKLTEVVTVIAKEGFVRAMNDFN